MITRQLAFTLLLAAQLHAADWWNKDWTQRQELTVNTGSDAANIGDALQGSAVLVRLHDGNFQFSSAAADGSDLRFIGSDGTLLPHHIEKYDSIVNEAFVWVEVPTIAANAKTSLHLYYGSANPAAAPALKPADVYDSALVYHFADKGGAPADATTNGNNASGPLTASEGAIIGSGARLLGADPVTIAASSSLEWNNGFTLSAWIRPSALQSGAVVLSRGEGAQSFKLVLDQGIPLIEVGALRSSPGQPVTAATWTHLAVSAEADKLSLFVNGEPYAQLSATLPALPGPIVLGGFASASRFVGEIDELNLSKAPRSAAWVKFAALSQGSTDAAQRTIALGEVEGGEGGGGHSQALEHVMLFGDIAKNMMFDGWIAIGVCIIMIVVGWTVAIQKFNYLNSIQKASREFLRRWKELSSDLTAIDHSDESSIGSFGGLADARAQSLIKKSPLYQIYHIGSDEIRHRLARDKDRTKGLSGRSIQAIRAALDGGLVQETHRLTKGLVFLTISIAGGPYVGLLGTVVGVMITFAIIAKSGEVDVNSIAPGIASALLATVAGLIVAIPALFIYSYLNSRIKETTSGMQVFIDEFVAKMAEFYPPAGEASPYAANTTPKE
ncbi:DUF2341 domain-containing protein [Luteolibacter sp. GHJ8]|uniref:DUF2341 domain-containing protein n=1 Tax=Luteolibacter rhizosphaerae TaxID=2989719 RepID=A0ABT3FWZ6_9BACT|nr:DUF2341 domain-containing protein [Luteolibacter rhizosphaerae]MCW1911942.1 DUF2341 domain-containing protein [Luteolibacter rhizosphaerae]